MNRNYTLLGEQLRQNYNPSGYRQVNALFEEQMIKSGGNNVVAFIRRAMMAVDIKYTQRTIEAGKRVKNHLMAVLSMVDYEYQGSVITDTHIKGFSDIDLLALSQAFYTWDALRVINSLDSLKKYPDSNKKVIDEIERMNKDRPFTSVEETLRKLRSDCEVQMRKQYRQADISKPKSIKIHNSDLHRDVDIVVGSWYYDLNSIKNAKSNEYSGVQIFNKHTGRRESADFPFRIAALINSRSSETQGRLKRIIRFLKNCKAVSKPDSSISSFDINAIAYDIDIAEYGDKNYIELVPVVFNQLYALSNERYKAESLMSVDGREPIFKGNEHKLEDLKALTALVAGILVDLRQEAA